MEDGIEQHMSMMTEFIVKQKNEQKIEKINPETHNEKQIEQIEQIEQNKIKTIERQKEKEKQD
jgi:hypothetical protein